MVAELTCGGDVPVSCPSLVRRRRLLTKPPPDTSPHRAVANLLDNVSQAVPCHSSSSADRRSAKSSPQSPVLEGNNTILCVYITKEYHYIICITHLHCESDCQRFILQCLWKPPSRKVRCDQRFVK